MKRIIAITGISLSIVIALFSCKSNTNVNVVDNSLMNTVTGTIGANTFSATGTDILVVSDTTVTLSCNSIGSGTSGDKLVLFIGNLNPGKTLFNSSSGFGFLPNTLLYLKSGSAVPLQATSGTLTINSHANSRIIGTFTCALSDNSTITSGKFNIIY